MDGVQIKLEGEKQLRKALRDFEDGTKDLKVVHAEAAKLVQLAARAPVVSGALAASIRSSGTARSGVVRAGKKSVPYAGPIHWGWPKRNIKANPFLSKALETETDEVVDVYEDGISKLLKKYDLK
jgi:hypothetical protein